MKIYPSKSSTPFAFINGVSYYENKENEVLFSMHTVFRTNDIKLLGENQRLIQTTIRINVNLLIAFEERLTLMRKDDIN